MVKSGRRQDVLITRRGNRKRGLFFGVMGVFFEVIFLFTWFFLATSDPEFLFFLFFLYNSEMTPFLFIAFTFGGGCLLIALKEFGWEESIHIKKVLMDEKPGIRKVSQLLFWSRILDIQNTQIISLRLHSIFLDRIGMNKTHQIEIDYRLSSNSSLDTLILYKDSNDRYFEPASTLVIKIHDVLALTEDIERTESAN
jgi:hypothetical protein